ncbi:hypothetical protein CVT25_009976 [Psilocybe cyanescens]|uniref:Uncharacterized protein n=1 Tax=Psilocybe cyanescens TaxID=93625 RepID=A0A409XCX3_PSICY|nr:hypothetical protein CVT25_009976 [Psilocybe cyanescens]
MPPKDSDYEINPAFLEVCINVSNQPTKSSIHSNVNIDSASTQRASSCIYKTDSTWPKRADGPEAHSFIRELRLVYSNHPITTAWPALLLNMEGYLDSALVKFTVIMGFAIAIATHS